MKALLQTRRYAYGLGYGELRAQRKRSGSVGIELKSGGDLVQQWRRKRGWRLEVCLRFIEYRLHRTNLSIRVDFNKGWQWATDATCVRRFSLYFPVSFTLRWGHRR